MEDTEKPCPGAPAGFLNWPSLSPRPPHMSLFLAFKRPYNLITYARGTRSAQGGPLTRHSRHSAWAHSTCRLVVQPLSHVQLFATPWTMAPQASLSSSAPEVCSDSCPLSQWCYITSSSSVVPFSSSFPASRSFPISHLFTSGDQKIGASALASVLPMNTQCWLSLRLTGLISLKSKGLSRVFSSITIQTIFQCSAFCIFQISHLYMTTGKTIALTIWTFVSKMMSLLFNMLSRFVTAFLQRSKHLCDFGAQENKICHCFHLFPFYLPWRDGTGCHEFRFLNVKF